VNAKDFNPCGKQIYRSEDEAYVALSKVQITSKSKRRKEIRVYKCTVCTSIDTWHLTREEPKLK
jgi:hypothetical protein